MELTFITIALVMILVIIAFVKDYYENKKITDMTVDERQKYLNEKQTILEYKKQKQLEEKRSRKESFNKILLEAKQRDMQRSQEISFGKINEEMMCPHCQTRGQIRTKHIKQKKGVSGGKATSAVLTGGLSLLVVGLSRKEEATQAHCCNCNNTWFF